MDNFSNAEKVSSLLIELRDGLKDLIDTLTSNPYESNSNSFWILMLLDDYIVGKNPEPMFTEQFHKLNSDYLQFERTLPLISELKADFNPILDELFLLSQNFIRDFDDQISALIENIVNTEKDQHPNRPFIITGFIKNNQYKKLYDICIKIRSEIIINKDGEFKVHPKGFACKIHSDTINEIYLSISKPPTKFISGNRTDFLAIFSSTPAPVKGTIEWLLMHNSKPNKTALFTLLKLILELDEVPREILRKANKLFHSGNKEIFQKKYTYPSDDSQYSTMTKHFKEVKKILKKARPV